MGMCVSFFGRLLATTFPDSQFLQVAAYLIAGLVTGSVNYWLVSKILLQKLRRISEVANAVSHGDIGKHCDMESHDLIGDIVKSFNEMAQNLRGMIGEIRLAAQLQSLVGRFKM
jgi:methyl-accepting chemotaxis protein